MGQYLNRIEKTVTAIERFEVSEIFSLSDGSDATADTGVCRLFAYTLDYKRLKICQSLFVVVIVVIFTVFK